MNEGLFRLLPPLRRLDHWLLLRIPRVWLTRVHIVASLAVPIYVLLFLLGSFVVRPLITPQTADFLMGETIWIPIGLVSWPSFIQSSMLISASYQRMVQTSSTTLVWLLIALLIVGGIASLFWVRSASRFSVERMTGRQQTGSFWLEWLSYALCSALFAGSVFMLYVASGPLPFEASATQRLEAATDRLVRRLAAERGFVYADYVDQYTGKIDLDRFIAAYVRAESYGAGTYRFLVSPEIEFQPNIYIRSNNSWKAMAPLRDGENAFLALLRQAGLEEAHSGDASPAGWFMRFFGSILFWWIVGLNAFFLFAAKRAPVNHLITIGIGTLVVLPIFSVVFSIIGAALFQDRAPGAKYISGEQRAYLALAFVYATLLLLCVLAIVAAYTARGYRRRFSIGVLLFPTVLGYLPLLLVYGLDIAWRSDPSLAGVDTLHQWANTLLPVAAASMPFLYLPLLPILNRALTRLGAMPRRA